jgi:ferric-dicitrate binding protein FerR (iron transport regulator)
MAGRFSSGYMSSMNHAAPQFDRPAQAQSDAAAPSDRSMRRAILWLSGGAFALLGLAGGLLWWRDGERLFTEGLISAIARCF